jgi:nicotinate-nucleotide pyrophosphorylase (carboxylating)
MRNVLSPATEELLERGGLVVDEVRRVVSLALDEDLANGPDVTTDATVPALHRSTARFVSRQSGCLAGVPVAVAVIEMVAGADTLTVHIRKGDGERVTSGDEVMSISGPTRALLTAERTALNLLGHLSGVASATSSWVEALAGTGARVRDTRKTIPGLRALQKYAVRCGGGVNHRMSLSDAALVKDNHVVAAGGVEEAFRLVRGRAADIPVEIEVDTIEQLQVALDAGADLVLLDNMSPQTMREAVQLVERHRVATGRAVLLEASGGLTLERAAEVGATGVHFVSVGALTHSVRVLDIGLDLEAIS